MLFDAFTQTETGREAQEGTGLGLTISRRFVQLMSGDITVKPELLSDLERATIVADISRIFSIIEDIRRLHPVKADVLESLINNYDYSQMLALIQEVKGKKKEG